MSTPYERVERSVFDSTGRETILFYTGRSTFSNFYLCPVTVHGRTYRTAEHYYQCWKALYFGDTERFELIYREPRPAKAKYLARTIKNFDKDAWQVVAPKIMEEVVCAKFSQNAAPKEKLLRTGNAVLVEATEFDTFWASGLNIMDDDNVNNLKWKGGNVLGQILMRVRERLRTRA